MEDVIRVEHLKKSYGDIIAVDDLSFSVKSEYSGSKYTGCPVCGNRYSGQTETLIPVTETSIYNVFMRQSA